MNESKLAHHARCLINQSVAYKACMQVCGRHFAACQVLAQRISKRTHIQTVMTVLLHMFGLCSSKCVLAVCAGVCVIVCVFVCWCARLFYVRLCLSLSFSVCVFVCV